MDAIFPWGWLTHFTERSTAKYQASQSAQDGRITLDVAKQEFMHLLELVFMAMQQMVHTPSFCEFLLASISYFDHKHCCRSGSYEDDKDNREII
jgi:hypothetical protein